MIGCRLCKVRLQVLDCYGRFGRRECWWLVMHLAAIKWPEPRTASHRTATPSLRHCPLALAEYLSPDWTHCRRILTLRFPIFSQPGKPRVVPQILELSLNFLGCPEELSLCPGMFNSFKKTLFNSEYHRLIAVRTTRN